MSRRKKKIQNNGIRSTVIVFIIMVCLFIIYKFNFTTKSEVEVTTPITFKEFGSDVSVKDNIPLHEDQNGDHYIILPEKVNGIFVNKYFVNEDVEEKEEEQNLSSNTISNTTQENSNTETNTSVKNENTVVSENTTTPENTVENSNQTTNQVVNQVIDQNNIENKENETENLENTESESLFDAAVRKNFSAEQSEKSLENEVSDSTSSEQEKEPVEKEETDKTEDNKDETTDKNDEIKDETDKTDGKNPADTENKTEEPSEDNSTKPEEEPKEEKPEDDKKENVETKPDSEEKSNSETTTPNPSKPDETVDLSGTTLKPGEKIYISEDDIKNETTNFEVEFQTVDVNGVKLYNQELTSDMLEAQISLVCYIPMGYHLEVKEEDTNNIQELKADVEEISKSTTLLAYDITITDGTNEFQPEEYYQVAKVSITSQAKLSTGDRSSSLEVLHIAEDKENNQINFEKIMISNKEEGKLEFATNEFSVYAIILYDAIQPDSITIDNYEKDRYFYLGKNYTDDISGENKGTYKEENFVKVNVEYYSYDYNSPLTEIVNTNPTATVVTGGRLGNNNNYYYDITVTAKANSKQDIDANKNWKLDLTVGTDFSLANTQKNNAGRNITQVGNVVTITGNDWSDWTCTDLQTYEYKVRLYFSAAGSTTIANPQVTAVQRHLVGYVGPERYATGTPIPIPDGEEGERQTLFRYILCCPKDAAGNISFDAIDNPFVDRPAGYGFDGWITDSGNLTLDNETKVQTQNYTVPADAKEITIKMYPNWQEANEVFINTNINGNGLSLNSPINNWATARSILNTNFKRATNASDRELNVFVLTGGQITNLSAITNARAYTITSLYDGTDYRSTNGITSNASLAVNNGTTGALYSLDADLQLYYLNITGSNNYNMNSGATGNLGNTYIYGNGKNFRIGRGMLPLNANTATTTFSQIQGGGSISNRYKLVIESGKYHNVQLGRASTVTFSTNAILVMGNDYDREKDENETLRVYDRMASRTGDGAGTPRDKNKPLYFMNIKSGTFGLDYFNANSNNDASDYFYSGIYLGGHGSARNDTGARVLKVEGGNIANIIGGLAVTEANRANVETMIYVTGGNIKNIVGGAGRSTTYGDRKIQVTGGNVEYSVFGGSNGVKSAGTDTGTIDGSSLVYIGGNAIIGNINDANAELYGAKNGNVFGAGNGNASMTQAGKVNTSHVIVNDNAQIRNSVYGGGNYGIVTPSGGGGTGPGPIDKQDVLEYQDKSNVIENGGKYIISNSSAFSNAININTAQNGVANYALLTTEFPPDRVYWQLEEVNGEYLIKNVSTNKYLSISHTASVGNGGNNRVTVTPNIVITNTPETYFSYQLSNHRLSTRVTGTAVSPNGKNQVDYDVPVYIIFNNGNWSASTSTTNSTVYFIDYEKLEIEPPPEEIPNEEEETDVIIDVLGGNVLQDIYGGSNQSNINCSTKVRSYDGIVNGTIYGGSNIKGTILESAYIYVYGGTIGNPNVSEDAIFGGGKGEPNNIGTVDNKITKDTLVFIRDNKNDITINGNIYGGSARGTVGGNSQVDISDSLSDKYSINLNNNNIFGGGKGENNIATTTGGFVKVYLDGGTYENTKVFGGCNINGSISQTILVKIGEKYPTRVKEVYGGGNKATVTNLTSSDYVYLYNNAEVGDAFNGGNEAGIDNNVQRAIYALGSKVNNLYGGSNTSGTLNNSYVYCKDGAQIENVYGGGKGINTQITNISNVNITSIKDDDTISSPLTTIGNVYGGGDEGIIGNNTNVNITNSKVTQTVYGGGNNASVGNYTDVNIEKSEITSIYGGGNNGPVLGYSNVDVLNLSDIGTIYGGGKAASVGNGNNIPQDTNITNVYVEKSTASNVYGGGEGTTANVYGNVDVTLIGDETQKTIVRNNIYGGGDAGPVEGSTNVSLTKVELDGSVNVGDITDVTGAVYGGGKAANVSENTSVTLNGESIAKYVYGGGKKGEATKTSVFILEKSQISDNVYGGGSLAKVSGSTYTFVDSSTIGKNLYGGGEAANVGSSTVLLVNDSTANNVYGGGDQGEVDTDTSVEISNAKVIGATLDANNNLVNGNVYGGGRGATSRVDTIMPGKIGGNTSVLIRNLSEIENSVFGGGQGITALLGDSSDVKITSSVIQNSVYGGGDNGFVTKNTNVGITSSDINGSAYGAGNGEPAVVKGKSYIYVEGNTKIKDNLFGGGNAAPTGETDTNINNDLTAKYDAPKVKADSVVDISGAEIGGNVYGGANSSVVFGDVAVNIGINAINDYYATINGETPKNYTVGKINIADTIYGGGEQMDPTKEFSFKTVSVEGFININIDGAGYDDGNGNTIYIGQNIFGSGHASRAGLDKAILDAYDSQNPYAADMLAEGTSDDDKYNNYVTLNGDVVVKNYGKVDDIKEGTSIQRCGDVVLNKVYLTLAGTTDSTNVHATVDFAFNQINALTLKNGSTLYLRHGANLLESYNSMYDDENGNEQYVTATITNEIVDTEGDTYTLNGNIATKGLTKYIVQSGIIYTITADGNPDEKVSEIASIKTKDVQADADNRIYMYSGINLDISSDEDLDADKFGPVKGMTFFGIYSSSMDNDFETGMFDRNYTVGNTINWDDRNYTHCYVQGLHEKNPEQDITKDGFYTNFEQFGKEIGANDELTEDNYADFEPTSYTTYITPTPAEENFYVWYAGPDSEFYYFPISLVASKYSTQGAHTLNLKEINFENATFTITGVEPDLSEGVVLCDKNTIPSVNPDQEAADNRFGLTMKTGNNAWNMNGSTEFYADPEGKGDCWEGTSVFKTENSKNTPSLSFYLTHSNNISENAKEDLGYYTIRMNLVYYKDALTKATAKVVIEIALKSKFYDDIGYDAAITPGRQYDLFAKSTTNITTKSTFTSYFELAVDNFKGEKSTIREFYTPGEDSVVPPGYDAEEKLNQFFTSNYRELTSEYAFPENTMITMVDRSDSNNPQYYYYRVTAADANVKKSFKLSEFQKMGNTETIPENYDNNIRDKYYNSSNGMDYEYECFMFIVDFENAEFGNIQDKYVIAENQGLSMTLKSDVTNYNGEKFQITLLEEHINTKSINYGIYNTESKIEIDANLSQNKIYLGMPTDLNIITNYKVSPNPNGATVTVYDTMYFDKKEGVKLTIFDEKGDVVKGAILLGTYFEVKSPNGDITAYYPRTDGTTRIKLSDKVSNSKSVVTLKTENSSLPTGKYKIVIESFGSADGIYYGVDASDTAEVELSIVNDSFGLDSTLPEEQVIIDKENGYTLEKDTGVIAEGSNKLNLNIKYNSGLTDPYMAISLYRRDYDNPYDRTYSLVDLADYVSEDLKELPKELQSAYEYKVTDADGKEVTKNGGYEAFGITELQNALPNVFDVADLKFDLTLKNKLKSGTYKIVFRLYDKNEKTVYEEVVNSENEIELVPKQVIEYQLIGDTFSYIIIK